MPMLTMLRSGRPVAPVHAPERTWPAKSAMRSRTWWTSGTTFGPPGPPSSTTAPRGARSAVCRTARFSVVLMRSPRYIASRHPATSVTSASSRSSVSVSSVTSCLE